VIIFKKQSRTTTKIWPLGLENKQDRTLENKDNEHNGISNRQSKKISQRQNRRGRHAGTQWIIDNTRRLESQCPPRLKIDRQERTDSTRQPEPQCTPRPEIDRQKEQTMPDSWRSGVPQCPKLTDNTDRQYPTAGALVSPEARI
jgi:hypothetical protein